MKEILIETGSCLVAAMLLMIWHEVIRLIVYACCQRSVHCFRTTPWKVWRYIDPIGIAPIFVQYLAMLSFGMFVANLFPVSTFDMGLLIAGTSPTGYLGMLKVDGTVKLIFVLVLLFDLIHYGASRLILLLL